jgi:MoxR-like ATPase
VSPRGSLALLRAAQARALVDGRDFLVPDDLKTLAVPALAHRVLLRATPGGEIDADAVIAGITDATPVPR